MLGAGLAGCHLADALAARGREVTLIERGGAVAAGASGNPAGVAKPFVTRAPSAAGDFLAAAHDALLARLGADDLAAAAGYRPCGALQLVESPYPPHPRYRVLDAAAASEAAGTELPAGALAFGSAGWLDPGALCRAVLEVAVSRGATLALDADIVGIDAPRAASGIHVTDRVARSGSTRGGAEPAARFPGGEAASRTHDTASPGEWTLRARDGRRWQAPTLVLASGASLGATPWTRTLPLLPARGQISRFALRGESKAPDQVVAGRHYAIPHDDTLYVGATFERGTDDARVRAADHASNAAGLAALLPGIAVRPDALSGHAGVRATTPDRLPLVGPVPDADACRALYADLSRGRAPESYPPPPCPPGLAVLGGFGSRGIVSTPFAAELLADWLGGGHELQRWTPQLHPIRFEIRALRRGESAAVPS